MRAERPVRLTPRMEEAVHELKGLITAQLQVLRSPSGLEYFSARGMCGTRP